MAIAPVLAADTAPAAPAPRRLGLRTVLFIAALLEAYDALSNVFILFGDMSEIPGPGFGGFLIKAHLAATRRWRWRRWYSPPSAMCVMRSSRSAPWSS